MTIQLFTSRSPYRTAGPVLSITAAALLPAVASAQITLAPMPQPDSLWHGSLAIGGSASSGNTKARVLTINTEAIKETPQDKIILRGLLNNGSSEVAGVDTTTADLLRLGGRYDTTLAQKWFAFSGGDAETNKSQGLESRWSLNTGLGYKAVREPTATWDVFAGVGYSRGAFTNGEVRQGAELTLGEESIHQLTPSTTFKQRWVVFPGPGDVGTRSSLDLTVATTLIGAWTMNVGWVHHYTSQVPEGVEKTDSLLTLGVGYKF